ncbi:DUF2975 domain-containing protein [Corynebacterium hindlerae]|uniref:DUF2975 domain-containing protein n=1 Tax=Corynebacterium hindlerae TaxID=699041 RepID=A0A7G5FCR9_9CORY|nr:DUF2975 domain-containing protein [Corynebacterium hindlerae]QMV84410.1 DUF2975 domain-containing protein [Corynebacterium hindlerae]
MDKKALRGISAANFGYTFILFLIGVSIFRLVFFQELSSPIGLLVSDVKSIHIPLEALKEGQPAIFLSSFVIKTIASIALCVTLLLAGRNFLKGDFFNRTNVKMFKVASWAALAYFFGQFFEMTGNNWVSATEGVQRNALPNGVDDPAFIPMYILMMVLTVTAIALNRAVKMQEDQEGLI